MYLAHASSVFFFFFGGGRALEQPFTAAVAAYVFLRQMRTRQSPMTRRPKKTKSIHSCAYVKGESGDYYCMYVCMFPRNQRLWVGEKVRLRPAYVYPYMPPRSFYDQRVYCRIMYQVPALLSPLSVLWSLSGKNRTSALRVTIGPAGRVRIFFCNLASGRLDSDQEVLETSRVGSGRVGSGRVGSGRVE